MSSNNEVDRGQATTQKVSPRVLTSPLPKDKASLRANKKKRRLFQLLAQGILRYRGPLVCTKTEHERWNQRAFIDILCNVFHYNCSERFALGHGMQTASQKFRDNVT